MMEIERDNEQNDAANGESGNSAQNAGQSSTTNYEVAYKALQKKHDKLVTKYNDLTASRDSLVEEYEGKLSELRVSNTNLDKQVKSLDGERSTLQSRNAQLEHSVKVGAMVATDEFRELLPLYAKGLLRTEGLDGDDLTNYLRDYAETIRGVTQGAAREGVKGSVPATPTNAASAAKSSADIRKELNAAAPGTPEWAALETAYFTALDLEQKS